MSGPAAGKAVSGPAARSAVSVPVTARVAGPVALLAALALLATAGCTPPGPGLVDPGPEPTPFAGCAALAGPPPDAAFAGAQAGTPPPGVPAPENLPMPEVSLPCFSDGVPVLVSALRGPAVVNLWASWCPPCRDELPVLQRFADRTAGSVHVVGVISKDSRQASASLADERGVDFPNLFDDDGKLFKALGRAALPVTLFVDRAGRIRLVHNDRALDEGTLDELAALHLGVPAP